MAENAQSYAAECAVIGSMMLDKDVIPQMADTLSIECFVDARLQKLFERIQEVYNDTGGAAFDLVLLRDKLNERFEMDDVGGLDFIKQLAESVPSSANANYYAGILLQKKLMRQMLARVAHLNNMASQKIIELGDMRNALEQAAVDTANADETNEPVTVKQSAYEVASKNGEYSGLITGFDRLDELTGGLRNGEVVIVAARPSMGKSAFMLNIAAKMSAKGVESVIFSFEMEHQSLTERLISNEAKVPLHVMRSQYLKYNENDYREFINAAQRIGEWPLYFDRSPTLSPAQFAMRLLKYKNKYKIKIAFIDYLQLMYMHGKRMENRQQEITRISAELKAAAKRADIPLVIVSQLNRGVESRTDKKPILSDLRESGSIEQDADIVILLHRKDYYTRENTGDADCIVAKNRQGRTGEFKLSWISEYVSFENINERITG